MSDQHDIIIIGSGMAGYTLLRELRKLDRDVAVTMICADAGDFYSKPMLSNALAGGKSPNQLVNQPARTMVESLDFELIPNTQITAIDPAANTISSASQSWRYRTLVLAVGANPIVLPMAGDAGAELVAVNHLDHYRYFHERLPQAKHVAIIGPGLIGCEFANDLLSQNKQVSVIGPDPWPISSLLPENVGRFLQARLEQAGVRFYLENSVQQVNHVDSGFKLDLQDGTELQAELVLSAIGLRAELSLNRSAGLDANRGYITDRYLRTSVDNIYALGDCAEVEGYHLPYILPIMQCARALARTLTGEETAVSYPPMPVAIKTPACPLVVAPPPADVEVLQWQYEETASGVKALCLDGDRLVGFALAGDSTSEKQRLARELSALI